MLTFAPPLDLTPAPWPAPAPSPSPSPPPRCHPFLLPVRVIYLTLRWGLARWSIVWQGSDDGIDGWMMASNRNGSDWWSVGCAYLHSSINYGQSASASALGQMLQLPLGSWLRPLLFIFGSSSNCHNGAKRTYAANHWKWKIEQGTGNRELGKSGTPENEDRYADGHLRPLASFGGPHCIFAYL